MSKLWLGKTFPGVNLDGQDAVKTLDTGESIDFEQLLQDDLAKPEEQRKYRKENLELSKLKAFVNDSLLQESFGNLVNLVNTSSIKLSFVN